MSLQAILAAIQENRSQLDMAETDEICTAALSRAKDSEHAIRVQLLEFAFGLLDRASQSQKNAFIDHMVDYMKQPETNKKQIGAQYYRKCTQLVDDTIRKASIRSLISKLDSDGANFSEETRLVLDVIVEERSILGEDEARLYDLIRTAATDAKNDESRIIALDYMRQLAAKKPLPRELETSIYDAARSSKEPVSKEAVEVLKKIKVSRLPSDIKRRLDELDTAAQTGTKVVPSA